MPYAVHLLYPEGAVTETQYATLAEARDACEAAFWDLPKPARVSLLVKDGDTHRIVWSLGT